MHRCPSHWLASTGFIVVIDEQYYFNAAHHAQAALHKGGFFVNHKSGWNSQESAKNETNENGQVK